jgi:tRNA (cmo5U34)-methyltransferase
MSVVSHLQITPAQYDRRIRTLIPHYDELVHEAARALGHAARPVRRIVDLGVGTGALAAACLEVAPRARVWGIDVDPAMMRVVPARLGRRARHVTLVHGSFLDTAVPPADAVVATYSLHHIRQRRDKQAFYRRCFAAIRPGGVFIIGDCAPAAAPPAFARDLDLWFDHLGRTFGGRAKGRQVYESWADEDVYVPLADECRLLERAGFDVEIPWRRSPFAVIVGLKGRH